MSRPSTPIQLRLIRCPGAPHRHPRPENENNNVRINVIPFPNLDDNDGYQTPQRRYNGVVPEIEVPNAPLKSNSFWSHCGRDRQDDIPKCCRRLFQ